MDQPFHSTCGSSAERHESTATDPSRPSSDEDFINLNSQREEDFRGYLADSENVRRAFKAFQCLRDILFETYDDRDQLAAEVTTLKEEVKKYIDGRMRMEGALTYVEDHQTALRATPAAPATAAPAPPPFLASATRSCHHRYAASVTVPFARHAVWIG